MMLPVRWIGRERGASLSNDRAFSFHCNRAGSYFRYTQGSEFESA